MTEIKKRILSNIMSLILGAGLGAGAYALKERITEPKMPGIEVSAPEEVGGGVILNKPESHGIEMVSTKIAREEYEANGISPMAENAYTLTATIEPSNASNKAVDWSVEFVDPSSEWARGKSVTDYVTVTPTSAGALTATVSNLGEFGAQIKVTVRSRDNSAAYASCTVDYAKKIKSIEFSEYSFVGEELPGCVSESEGKTVWTIKDHGFDAGNSLVLKAKNIEYSSVYTIDDTFSVGYQKRYNEELGEGGCHSLTAGATEYAAFEGKISPGPLVFAEAFAAEVDGGGLITDSYNGEIDIDNYEHYIEACMSVETIMYVKVEYKGIYSSYTEEIEVRAEEELFTIPTREISLNKTNIAF